MFNCPEKVLLYAHRVQDLFVRKGRDQAMKKLIAVGAVLLILGLYIVVGLGAV